MDAYLECSPVIDYDDTAIAALAESLKAHHVTPPAYAEAAYNFVRDKISHSADIADSQKVTCKASDLLKAFVTPSRICWRRCCATTALSAAFAIRCCGKALVRINYACMV